MQLDHEFTVPVPAVRAWPVLLDIDRVGPCMPGATITKVDGDDVEGTVKVKVGPITVTYAGTASFLEKDESTRRAVIEARGRETRGTGTATARVTAQLHDQGEATRVTVSTDLAITGKPAQFGRGVMADVGAKLLGRFADCLSSQLTAGEGAAEAQPAAAPAGSAGGPPPGEAAGGVAPAERPPGGTVPAPAAGDGMDGARAGAPASVLDAPASAAGQAGREAEAIDLLDAARGPVLKRVAPVLGLAALVALLLALLRRRADPRVSRRSHR